jgi:hypothetical protein
LAVKKDKTAEGNLGRHTFISLTAEEILKGWVDLQQAGFGVTIKQVRSFAFKICEERTTPQKKKKYDDDLPNEGISGMTPNGYITNEEFCGFLHHFNNHRLPGRPLVILDGHRSHLDSSVLDVAENLGIQLYLPVHCSHELQPLDKSSFKSLKP